VASPRTATAAEKRFTAPSLVSRSAHPRGPLLMRGRMGKSQGVNAFGSIPSCTAELAFPNPKPRKARYPAARGSAGIT